MLSGKYEVQPAEGEDATRAGQAIWSYVSEVYGPSDPKHPVHDPREPQRRERFLFVLGVSLKTLTDEC